MAVIHAPVIPELHKQISLKFRQETPNPKDANEILVKDNSILQEDTNSTVLDITTDTFSNIHTKDSWEQIKIKLDQNIILHIKYKLEKPEETSRNLKQNKKKTTKRPQKKHEGQNEEKSSRNKYKVN